MIVLTLGTIFFPFDRAVNWLQILLETEVIVEPVLLQYGATSAEHLNHPLLTKVASLSRQEMHEAIEQASFVISHAGQGSTRLLADMNVRFILLPRMKRYGEHVDNHQFLFARALEKYGIYHCTEINQLVNYVNQPPAPFNGDLFNAPLLVEHLMQQYGRPLPTPLVGRGLRRMV